MLCAVTNTFSICKGLMSIDQHFNDPMHFCLIAIDIIFVNALYV